ncbi:MAG TPA: phosphate signaling complex protein PhoU [Thiolapillus brandeum]|uniref:Phosphate signaling complex protein PhoU n=1 Tax=Thiolapillus brandeum TaxID=1076588 RepID=A0A831KD00_9GAMM|nr:phosphate signaling complex protein PhoU [Thiolapillus brandeum]
MIHDFSHSQGHILKRFDEDMRKLQKRVLKMARLVREQMTGLQKVLSGSKEDSTEHVMESDRSVDLLEVKVDKFIIRLLARRAPVGGDLRFIVTASRIVTDLERLGDETVQIARVMDKEYGNLGVCNGRVVEDEVRELLALLIALFDQAIQAFSVYDYQAAMELAEGKTGSDGEMHKRMQQLSACAQLKDCDVSQAVNLVLILRSMERGLRYVQNIGEHVIYLATGKDVRHKGN